MEQKGQSYNFALKTNNSRIRYSYTSPYVLMPSSAYLYVTMTVQFSSIPLQRVAAGLLIIFLNLGDLILNAIAEDVIDAEHRRIF